MTRGYWYIKSFIFFDRGSDGSMSVRAEVFDFLEAEGATDGICLEGFTSRMDESPWNEGKFK